MSRPGTSGTTVTQTNTMITETNTTLPSIQSLSVAGNPKAVKDSIVYSAGSFEEIRVARNHRPGWVTPEQNTLDYGTPDNQNIPNFSKLESFAKTQQSSETIIIRKEQTSTSSISNFIKKTEECHVPKKKVVSFSTSTDSTHIDRYGHLNGYIYFNYLRSNFKPRHRVERSGKRTPTNFQDNRPFLGT